MPTTPTMFAVVRPDGYGKRQFVSVPWVTALLEPVEVPRRYYALEPEPEDEPAPEPRRNGNYGARPRRNGKQFEPLE